MTLSAPVPMAIAYSRAAVTNASIEPLSGRLNNINRFATGPGSNPRGGPTIRSSSDADLAEGIEKRRMEFFVMALEFGARVAMAARRQDDGVLHQSHYSASSLCLAFSMIGPTSSNCLA